MSGISEKAKTGREICDSIMEFYKGLGMARLEGKRYISLEEFKRRELEEWVRLEDANEQTSKAIELGLLELKHLKEIYERERGEQKQKLQTFYDALMAIIPKTVKIEEYNKETKESWIVQTADPSEWSMFIDSLDGLLVKFKELFRK